MPQPSDSEMGELETALDELRKIFVMEGQTSHGRELMLAEIQQTRLAGAQVALNSTIPARARMVGDAGGVRDGRLGGFLGGYLPVTGELDSIIGPSSNPSVGMLRLGERMRELLNQQRSARNEERTRDRFSAHREKRFVEPTPDDPAEPAMLPLGVSEMPDDMIFGSRNAQTASFDRLPDEARDWYLRTSSDNNAAAGPLDDVFHGLPDEVREKYDKDFRRQQAQRQFPEN